MRIILLALAWFLISAAPADAPIGTFQTWASYKKLPLDFTSGGVIVHVEAMPCSNPPATESESCRYDGFNNQAFVTVGGRGVAPMTVLTDKQSAYARIAVVRFDWHDPRPGVIVESQYGGSGGKLTLQLLVPSSNSYRSVSLEDYNGADLEVQLADLPEDLSGDGRIDLKFEDGAFDSIFGCNACTPRPPVFFAVKEGKIVDESRDPALRGLFAADMVRSAPICLSNKRYRNGACAAYTADAARAGQFEAAWALMLKHYEHGSDLWEPCDMPVSAWVNHRCPEGHVTHFRDFPESLHAYLVRTGYLSSPSQPFVMQKSKVLHQSFGLN
ncbi:hypothetical protein [Sphingomonas faeni]|uniref:hypothetical protein n=1 Tax=Sphingomonas faeni TaxID=185950 RepID=UPI00241335EC|nr:hypothetical protein [Sphingomonas faeni]